MRSCLPLVKPGAESFQAPPLGSARGAALSDRLADKLADALCLLDEAIEMTESEGVLRITDIARDPMRRAREEINDVMRKLEN